MAIIIGLRFNEMGQTHYFRSRDNNIAEGTFCLAETNRGVECGQVVSIAPLEKKSEQPEQSLRSIISVASDEDVRRVEFNKRKSIEAFEIANKKIQKHQLEMKLVRVECLFDCSKILFYFSAEGRVDFRELVKDLASVFRARIELRQIGVRDEAKLLGGLGICGRGFCCSTFLPEFAPVSIKMAKEQGLSLNPSKISGMCGRLMCCLKYEQDIYDELLQITPPIGAYVKTSEGKGVIIGANIFSGTVHVKLDKAPEGIPFVAQREQIKILKMPRRSDSSD